MQKISLSALKVLKVLVLLNILFFIAFYLTQYVTRDTVWLPNERHPFATLNVGEEVSVPTWYNQSLLLFAGVLLLMISRGVKQANKRWALLGAIFVYLSIDEGAGLHELLIEPTQQILGINAGVFYYAWVIPFALLVAVLSIFYLSWFLRLPLRTKVIFAAALVIYVAGSIGIEMFSASYVTADAIRDTDWHMTLGLLVGIEEFLEMFGVTIFIYGILDYVNRDKSIKSKYALQITK